MLAGTRAYLNNAWKVSGKTEKEMLALLSKSGLKTHREVRSHAMEALGLGHRHANALAACYLKQEWQSGAAAVKKAAPPEEGTSEGEVRLLCLPPATAPAS